MIWKEHEETNKDLIWLLFPEVKKGLNRPVPIEMEHLEILVLFKIKSKCHVTYRICFIVERKAPVPDLWPKTPG